MTDYNMVTDGTTAMNNIQNQMNNLNASRQMSTGAPNVNINSWFSNNANPVNQAGAFNGRKGSKTKFSQQYISN